MGKTAFIGDTMIKKRGTAIMVKTGKIITVENKGDKTIVNIDFMDNTKATVVLAYEEDPNRYKGKYVVCGIDFHDNTNILAIMNDEND
jgi:hypothetical protein